MIAFLRGISYRIRSRFQRDTLDAELAEELRLHRELLTAEELARGVSPDDAVRVAAVRLGNTTALREKSRLEWSLGWIDAFARDMRYAGRFLRRSPVFTTVAVLSIGLGVGANAAVFTLVDRVFLRPPSGVSDDGRLRRLYLRWDAGENPYVRGVLAWAEYYAIDSASRVFESLAGYNYPSPVKLGTELDAPTARRTLATWRYFQILGIRPAFGRLFVEDDDREGAPPVAILSHAWWERQFGSDTAVLGRVVTLGGQQVTLVGIAQRGFAGLELQPADLWMTPGAVAGKSGSSAWRTGRGTAGTSVLARLRGGVGEGLAAGELARTILAMPTTSARWMEQDFSAEFGPLIHARGPEKKDAGITVAVRLAAAALLVLLAGCANLGNLLLARGLARQRELAVRLAMGVGRARLLSQLFAEALVLCSIGALVALAIAHSGGRILRVLVMPDVAWNSAPVDGRIIAFTLLVSFTVGVVAALVPAWRSSRTDVNQALKAGRQEHGSAPRMRNSLLAAQLALSVALLVGAGLFTRSLVRAATFDVGFDARSTVMIRMNLQGAPRSAAEWSTVTSDAMERLRALPEVAEVGATFALPFYSISFERLSIPERDVSKELLGTRNFLFPTTAAAMRALGVRLLRGRLLEETDERGAAPVVVLGEGLARRLWPGEDAIGRRVRIGPDSLPYAEVVGVTRDLITYHLTESEESQFFVPPGQIGWEAHDLLVRVRGDAGSATGRLRAALLGWRSDFSSLTVTPVRSEIEEQFGPWRLGAWVFTGFGVIALILAAIGVFGMVSFTVTRRTSEFGIRSALGATRSRLAGLVLGETAVIAFTGLLLGLGLALFGSRWLEGLLFHTSARDLVSILAASMLLLVVAMVAALGPTWRAGHVDPVSALRAE